MTTLISQPQMNMKKPYDHMVNKGISPQNIDHLPGQGCRHAVHGWLAQTRQPKLCAFRAWRVAFGKAAFKGHWKSPNVGNMTLVEMPKRDRNADVFLCFSHDFNHILTWFSFIVMRVFPRSAWSASASLSAAPSGESLDQLMQKSKDLVMSK